jgi:hypothetical protein
MLPPGIIRREIPMSILWDVDFCEGKPTVDGIHKLQKLDAYKDTYILCGNEIYPYYNWFS